MIELFSFVRKKFANLSAFECLDHASLDAVKNHFSMPTPVPTEGKVYVLMELENTPFEEAEAGLQEIFESKLALDGIMAQSEVEANTLWKYREGVAESLLSGHDVHQEDVSVPVAHLQEFYSKIENRYQEAFPDFKVFFFGHIGDGNLHIFIQRPQSWSLEKFTETAKASDLELFKLLAEYQGSVSAEHGVGILKKHAIHFSRSKAELVLMRNVKRAFDPEGRLNPGKVIDGTEVQLPSS